ncbi:MAG: hypothetical protein ABSA09_12770 [Desulfobaccales bacterium]|jgi:hypothetical protein
MEIKKLLQKSFDNAKDIAFKNKDISDFTDGKNRESSKVLFNKYPQ